ncbi:hypothetical protein ACLOJK_031838 [Asimina triloba]
MKALRRSADSRGPRRSPSHLLQILDFFTVKLQFEHMKVESLWPSLSLTKVRMSLSNSKPGPFFRLYQYSFSRSSVGKDLKYADSHGWVKAEGTSATMGITDHAQVAIVWKVVEINTELGDSPGLVSHPLPAVHFKCSLMAVRDVNASPYENGWIIKVEMSDSNENIPSSVKKKTLSIEGEPPVDGSVQTFGNKKMVQAL